MVLGRVREADRVPKPVGGSATNAFIGVSEQGGENRGRMVEHFLRGVSLPPGQPWCAACVHHVGHSAPAASVAGTLPLTFTQR